MTAICNLANKGATVTLQDGSTMSVADLARMAIDKGPEHVCSLFGLDYRNLP